MKPSAPRHILVFEPSMAGHHLSWLRYIAEDLLWAGYKLTLAVDMGPVSRKLLQDSLADLLPEVSLLSVFDDTGKFHGGSMTEALGHCLEKSGAQEAFVNNLDHIASSCLRRAALGIMPPESLRGRISGVYFRPRFLANPAWPPGNILKAAGFNRLCRQRWFNHILFMDEALLAQAEERYAGADFHLLPDPWDGDFSLSQKEARANLGIPMDRYVLLHYGIGDRRKGLHLTVRAMQDSAPEAPLFLLCAGKIGGDSENIKALRELEAQGRALVLNRYVSGPDERRCFCASDAVLLTYIHHFGSSGVLSLAAAAGKMVIASDEGLIGQRVRNHKLGLLFKSGDWSELQKCLARAASTSEADRAGYQKAALAYGASCTRTAFRDALLAALSVR